MSAAALDTLLLAAHARGEVVLYIPTRERRERSPALTFVTVTRGGK